MNASFNFLIYCSVGTNFKESIASTVSGSACVGRLWPTRPPTASEVSAAAATAPAAPATVNVSSNNNNNNAAEEEIELALWREAAAATAHPTEADVDAIKAERE